MTQTTVTFSLEEFLKDFKSDINKQLAEIKQDVKEFRQETDKQFTEINVKLATLTEKVDGIDKRVTKLEGTLTIQLWALIIAVFGACAKYIFFPNFPNS